jgi:hypothetical protein
MECHIPRASERRTGRFSDGIERSPRTEASTPTAARTVPPTQANEGAKIP